MHNLFRTNLMSIGHFGRLCLLSVLISVCHGTVRLSIANVTYRTVALTGDPVPGTQSGVDLLKFDTPVINNDGETAFTSTLFGTGVNAATNRAVLSEAGGTGLGLVARKINPAPGTRSGITYLDFGDPFISNTGETFFIASLNGFGINWSNELGLWSHNGNSDLELIAWEGQQAPNTGAGTDYFDFRDLKVNRSGQVVITSKLNGGDADLTNNHGVWSEGGDAGLTLIARKGAPAPDTGPGVHFDLNSFLFPSINDAGEVAFRANMVGTDVDSSNDMAIWSQGGTGDLALIARSGDQAPGLEAGINFIVLGHPSINNAGQIAFEGIVEGPGVYDTLYNGIWLQGGGTDLDLIVREGEQASETPADVIYFDFSGISINRTGDVAFGGSLTGPGIDSTNNAGLWSHNRNTGLTKIVQTGDPAPGTGEGVKFSRINSFTFNAAGQTAFSAELTGTNISLFNNKGIWVEVDDTLTLIARTGDLFEVSPGQFKTIFLLNSFGTNGNDNGNRSSFNDEGQFAFHAAFTDGTEGVFVANAIPEPTTLLLLYTSTVWQLTRRQGNA